jgi:hypothetical protein
MQYLGRQEPGSPWTLKDRGLAQGLMLHEEGFNRLGVPHHVAQDPENAGFFEVDDTLIDHAEAAFEEWQRQNERPEPGVLPVVRLDERAVRAAKTRREARRAQAEDPPGAPAQAADERPLS